MSFITKRERVFNDYDLFDLPARNEGKLKDYASCTDARAWSHFGSDKTEHLVDVIKRNNETVTAKYIPTDVIVDTLMVVKNAEIARLKRKIEDFEKMMTAYDQLELTCEQKCEIAHAHAAIKAANKELDELFLDLDLSGFTEGIDSEGFATGHSKGDELTEPLTSHSRGDETSHSKGDETGHSKRDETGHTKGDEENSKDSKAVQKDPITNDVATLVNDPRISEMQDAIITKDAKLSAMTNTIAVMENDVCEPYCIYAHIYTALERILAILCQNDKYRQYLKLMTTGRDIRCLDIKGKILFKLKVLEKFSCALIAPCTQEFSADPHQQTEDCACFHVKLVESRNQPTTTYAVTSAELKTPNLDNKRAQLVADIIENDEMKLILSLDNSPIIVTGEDQTDEGLIVDNLYNIDKENLNRLKSIQANYDELLKFYETLKHEKERLEKRCFNYDEMEKEYEDLKVQMHEYSSLWNEKEHYKKRSADLDSLKEQYLVLTDETSNLETQLRAESEINSIKSNAMKSLRSDTISLSKQLNESSIAYEKEKNNLMCKLKEADCRIMCQEQQIKTLLQQIDELIEQDQGKVSRDQETHELALLDEMESLKDLVKTLKDALLCNEEEKQDIQQHYQHDLELINALKLEIEDWKSTYEKSLQRNDYLEKCNESLIEERRHSNQDLEEKSNAVDNLINVIKNKSLEINKLMQEVEKEKDQNRNLYKQLNEMRDRFDINRVSLENEKLVALQSLQVARQESKELLNKVKDYDEVIHKKADVTKSLEQQLQDNKELQDLLMTTVEENKNLKKKIDSLENHKSVLVEEIQRLHNINEYAVASINSLQDQNNQYEISLDSTQKESSKLKDKMMDYDNISLQLQNLQNSHGKLVNEKMRLQNELLKNSYELDNAKHSIRLSRRESEEIIDKLQQSEGSKDNEISRVREAYQNLSSEKYEVQKALFEKTRELDNLLQVLNDMKLEKDNLLQERCRADGLEQESKGLKKALAELSNEKNNLLNKTEEYNHLCNSLENKIEENRELMEQIKSLEAKQATATNAMETLQNEKIITESKLNVIKQECFELENKIKNYETVESEYKNLKHSHDQMNHEKENLQSELYSQLARLWKIEHENSELHSQSEILLTHSEDLESALIDARTQLIKKSSNTVESFKDIMDEIAVMRQEKLQNQEKIRGLLDRQEYAENIISSLRDDVAVRDCKIATLQNHINELEEEVLRLHSSLDEVISTGEQMKDLSLEKMETLQKIEAHHSRATHNMKMELAKLQNENFKLSEQLSVTKIKSDESLRNKYQYASQLKHLINEREKIVTDITQLELESVGDSALAPNNCNIEDILASIDRVKKSLKSRNTKNSSLERTLLKVQTSSQLLLSKADEAKKIVEREKQKIICEKEDAIIDKQNMETQLFDLKAKLEKQIANDKVVIGNLESTIKNQKLIIDRINKSTQDYISTLKLELQTVQDLYKNSAERIGELQEKLLSMTEDKNHLSVALAEITEDLRKKSNEVAELQTELDNLKLKKKSHRNVEAQASIKDIKNEASQSLEENLPVKTREVDRERHTQPEMNMESPFFENKVVAAAFLEQPFNVIKSSYVDYKMKLLSTGRLEQHSITCFSEEESKENIETTSSPSREPIKLANEHGNNLIDIYNRQTIDNSSSRENDESANMTTHASKSQAKSTGHTSTRESYEPDSNIRSKYKDSKTYEESSSDKSTDKDFFVIYKDSDSSGNNIKGQAKGAWSGKSPDVVVEAVTIHPTAKEIGSDVNRHKKNIEEGTFVFEEIYDVDNLKHKLKIDIPRVTTDSPSILTTSDLDKKSFDSSTVALQFDSYTKVNERLDDKTIMFSLPTISDEGKKFLESYNSLSMGSDEDTVTPRINQRHAFETDSSTSKHKDSQIPSKKARISSPLNNESHHKLSRVGADVLLLKAEQEQKNPQIGMRQNFGLEYIMDTVQSEIAPELRKTKSDERFNLLKTREKIDSPSKLSKMSLSEYVSSNSKSRDRSSQKLYTERSIMAKLDANKDYEIQINTLTKALENIEKDYKKKIKAIKVQYDSNIKSIINDHNLGVKSIQSLHEETLQDIIKLHESEVENLRAMSMDAMRKADKLEKENRALKTKIKVSKTCLDEEPIKMISPEIKKRRKCRDDTRMLTKTTVEAFNVKPKKTSSGPCTCSMDVNVSDTIRSIFEQVDVEQRKMAEHTYLRYIVNKILNGNLGGAEKLDALQTLDAQELSFLHFKVCRAWKMKLTKEEALQKRIYSLENELINKQRSAQQHIADLDRKVVEERRRLEQVREAVCRRSTASSREPSPHPDLHVACSPALGASAENDACGCSAQTFSLAVTSLPSAGDLVARPSSGLRATRRPRPDIHRVTYGRKEAEERRDRRLTYNDEPPTRLRRLHDRQPPRSATKK